jgi:hypothetical protein
VTRRYRVRWCLLPNEHGYGRYEADDIVDAYTAADAVTQVSVKRGDQYRVLSVEPFDAPDEALLGSVTDV